MKNADVIVNDHIVSITPRMFSFSVRIGQSEYEFFCKDEEHKFAIAWIIPHTDDQELIGIMQSALDIFRKERREESWNNLQFIEHSEQDILNTPEERFHFYSFDDAKIGVFPTSISGPHHGYVIAYDNKRLLVNAEGFHDRQKGDSEYIYLWSVRDDQGKVNDETSNYNIIRVIRRHYETTDPDTKLFFV